MEAKWSDRKYKQLTNVGTNEPKTHQVDSISNDTLRLFEDKVYIHYFDGKARLAEIQGKDNWGNIL